MVIATLEVFKHDLHNVQNTFDPGASDAAFYDQPIAPDRIRWLRQRLRPLISSPMLPFVDRLEAESAAEFSVVASISERMRDADRQATYGELRDEIQAVLNRTEDLQKVLRAQAEKAKAFAVGGSETPSDRRSLALDR